MNMLTAWKPNGLSPPKRQFNANERLTSGRATVGELGSGRNGPGRSGEPTSGQSEVIDGFLTIATSSSRMNGALRPRPYTATMAMASTAVAIQVGHFSLGAPDELPSVLLIESPSRPGLDRGGTIATFPSTKSLQI